MSSRTFLLGLLQKSNGARGRVLDTIHEKLGEIIVFPYIFLSKQYVMNLFSEYANELPPFKDYL